jgi:hypothetical protein
MKRLKPWTPSDVFGCLRIRDSQSLSSDNNSMFPSMCVKLATRASGTDESVMKYFCWMWNSLAIEVDAWDQTKPHIKIQEKEKEVMCTWLACICTNTQRIQSFALIIVTLPYLTALLVATDASLSRKMNLRYYCDSVEGACSNNTECQCQTLYYYKGSICTRQASCSCLQACDAANNCANPDTLCIMDSRCGYKPLCYPSNLYSPDACPPPQFVYPTETTTYPIESTTFLAVGRKKRASKF